MSNAQLGLVLFSILGFCGFLALGAFLGKVMTPGKLATFAGIIALVAVFGFSIFAAYYFIASPK